MLKGRLRAVSMVEKSIFEFFFEDVPSWCEVTGISYETPVTRISCEAPVETPSPPCCEERPVALGGTVEVERLPSNLS